ncbi:radical SAM family heme chaperone HemW [bacterium]|nr:radical SAM family heme chaperone HemW [bacterium]
MIKNAYIHIPFCTGKCFYCSFVSGISPNYKEEYLSALIKQIKNEYRNEPVETLYLGGGTPSLLEPDDIKKIIECFDLSKAEEITLETNPETVTAEKFTEYKKLGINRVSLGVQTFDNTILKLIGRRHNADTINKSICDIKSAEFSNISIDLIYGLPNQNLDLFKNDLEKAINFDIQHISTYGLKIEEGSLFYKNMPKSLPDDEEQAQMYLYLCDFLRKSNFEHYEISNFAKKGYESKHNNAYWQNKEYYGFGLNASGYRDNIRYKNISNFEEYIKNPFEKEEKIHLSLQETRENEIFLALRLKEGLDIDSFNKKYNVDFEGKYKNIIKKYSDLNMLKTKNRKCFLTKKGILLSNEIMSEFIE